MNVRAGLDWPAVVATAWKVPYAPRGSNPPQPDGFVAARFQEIVSSSGTPRLKCTVFAAAGAHAAESHTICPWYVTTTRTDPAPNASWHSPAAVETANT